LGRRRTRGGGTGLMQAGQMEGVMMVMMAKEVVEEVRDAAE
jgi:hypothetical protein